MRGRGVSHAPRPVSSAGVVLALALALAASGCGPRAPQNPAASSGPQTPAGYRSPPSLKTVGRDRAGQLTLSGRAEAGASVRLTTPSGETMTTSADPQGVWRIRAQASNAVRLFGLAMRHGAAWLQAQGYVAILPPATGAMLRSGSGALILADRAKAPRLLAVDYDAGRAGSVAVVISGIAPAGDEVALSVDGATVGRTKAGSDGRFAVAPDAPLRSGAHDLLAASKAGRSAARVMISPAPGLATPFAAVPLAQGGWRIAWRTPGGGVQATIVLP